MKIRSGIAVLAVSALLAVPASAAMYHDNTYSTAYDNGVKYGYKTGYDDGYEAGKNDAPTGDYQDGYVAGQREGYNAGVTDAYSDGYEAGKKESSDKAYNNGYKQGVSDGTIRASSKLPFNWIYGVIFIAFIIVVCIIEHHECQQFTPANIKSRCNDSYSHGYLHAYSQIMREKGANHHA